MERVYNFSAGPSIMPESVLRTAGAEILNYRGSGMSVMEMSHRSAVFQEIFDSTKAKLRAVLKVPEPRDTSFAGRRDAAIRRDTDEPHQKRQCGLCRHGEFLR